MDALAKKAKCSKIAVINAASRLPSELNATYHDALERINSQDEEDSHLARQILSWICLTYEPLTLRLLQQALACQREESSWDEESLIGPDLLLAAIDAESQIVQLVHYTTQGYLQRHPYHFMPDAEKQISSTCLNKLLNVANSHRSRENVTVPFQGLEMFMKAKPLLPCAICYSTLRLQATPDPSQLDTIRRLFWHHSDRPFAETCI